MVLCLGWMQTRMLERVGRTQLIRGTAWRQLKMTSHSLISRCSCRHKKPCNVRASSILLRGLQTNKKRTRIHVSSSRHTCDATCTRPTQNGNRWTKSSWFTIPVVTQSVCLFDVRSNRQIHCTATLHTFRPIFE